MPCTLLCAFLTRRGVERHAAWPGFYRRGATGAMARWFSVALRQLNRKGRHSATGLMAGSVSKTPLFFIKSKQGMFSEVLENIGLTVIRN